MCKPAIERARDRTNGVLKEGQAFIEFRRVEGSGAHYNIRMAVDVFRDRMYDYISTMVERILNIWGEKGIVHNYQYAVLMSYCHHGADVHE